MLQKANVTAASVEDAGDELVTLDHAVRGAREANVVARVLREQDLVPRPDTLDVRPDEDDDPAAAVRLEARRKDEPGTRLGLLLGVLDDDEVVERLERQPRRTRILQHAATIL